MTTKESDYQVALLFLSFRRPAGTSSLTALENKLFFWDRAAGLLPETGMPLMAMGINLYQHEDACGVAHLLPS